MTAFGQKNVLKGNRLYDLNMFEEAIVYYEKELDGSGDRDSKQEALTKLANCYRLLGRFEEAEEVYKKIFKRKRKDPENVLNYALALKASAKYAEAKEEFERYIKLNPDDPMGPNYVKSCDLAQQWLEENLGKTVKNLMLVNSPDPDIAPTFYQDGIVFSSSREGSMQKLISFKGGENEVKLDLYYASLAGGEEQSLPKGLTGLNSYMHEGPASFSADGQEVFFTRTVEGKRNRKENVVLSTLQLFHATLDTAGNWTVPTGDFVHNSDAYSVGHPTLSADGKRLFFMSDMPGGFGGTDIYYVEKQADGSWSEAVNLGPEVNTFGYELYPFIHQDGTLYFSSNVHPGMGKLDVFSAKEMFGEWTAVQNLQPPVNSIGDDFGYIVDTENRLGFFSSNRFDGLGSDDLFSFINEGLLDIGLDGNMVRVKNLSVFDGITYKITDAETKEPVPVTEKDGQLIFELTEVGKEYKLVARKEGFPYNKVTLKLESQPTDEIVKVSMTPRMRPILVHGWAKQGEVVTTQVDGRDTTITNISPMVGAGASLKLDGASVEQNRTDDQGFYRFDQEMSPGGAYSVEVKRGMRITDETVAKLTGTVFENDEGLQGGLVLLLLEGDIMDQFLTGKNGAYKFQVQEPGSYTVLAQKTGYVSAYKPVNVNTTDFGENIVTDLNVDPKEMLPIEGMVSVDGAPVPGASVTITRDGNVVKKMVSAEDGSFNYRVLQGYDYVVTVGKKGYFQRDKAVSTKALRKGFEGPITLDFPLEKLQVNKSIAIDNLYYDVNSADIQTQSISTIDRLVEFMEMNPTVKIELSSHTDSRGSGDYNMKLSQQRADRVTMYLFFEGIDEDRIVAKGYGETRLVNHCSDAMECPEEEHQKNRRTEIKIISY